MTMNESTKKDIHTAQAFDEIKEAPEEEEKESRSGTILSKGSSERSTTFFFKGNSSDEGEPEKEDEGDKLKRKQREQELLHEIGLLEREVQEEEKEGIEGAKDEEDDQTVTDTVIDLHFDHEADEEDRKEDKDIQEKLFSQEKEVDSLENALAQKQELLDAIVESNKEMKKEIVDAMKQEYLKKIIKLQNDIKKTESKRERDLLKAKNESSKNSVNTEYKRKIKQMEKELKLLKKKDREQVDKLRISNKQKDQITKLKEDISSIKNQKVSLMRQLKEDREKHRKWKNEKTKSLMQMKRANQKKDQQITNLKRENSKKANILRRKVEELKALQKRQKADLTKHRKALNQKRRAKKINPEKIKQWVMDNTQKLMRYQDIKEELEKEQSARMKTEQEIEEEQTQFAEIQTKKEKLEAKRSLTNPDDKDAIEEIDSELRGYELELNNINENLESLEDKLDFVNEKISVFNKEVIEINPEGIERLRFEEINNLEEAKVYLGSFFNIFLEMNVYRTMVENKILDQDEIIEKQHIEIQELQTKLQASEIKFREEINKMAQKYKQKQEEIKQEISELMEQDPTYLNISQMPPSGNFRGKPPKDKGNKGVPPKSIGQLRDEIKNRKQALKEVARVQASSKIGLSKLVTSLEKQTIEDEKKIKILNHKLKQAAHEKQMFKQKYETLKHKIKLDETDEIKLLKTISLETISKSQNSSFISSANNYEEGLRSYENPKILRRQNSSKGRKKTKTNSERGLKSPREKIPRDLQNRTPSQSKQLKDISPCGRFDYGTAGSLSKSLFSGGVTTTPAPKTPKVTGSIHAFVKDEAKSED